MQMQDKLLGLHAAPLQDMQLPLQGQAAGPAKLLRHTSCVWLQRLGATVTHRAHQGLLPQCCVTTSSAGSSLRYALCAHVQPFVSLEGSTGF